MSGLCDSINEMTLELDSILKNKPPDKNKLLEFYKKYNINYDNSKIDEINNCVAANSQVAYNIVDQTECSDAVKKMCTSFYKTDDKIIECRKKYAPVSTNVIQSNKSVINDSCIIKSIITDENTKKNDKYNIALNLSLNNTKLDCTIYNSEDKIKAFNNCITNNMSIQSNIINSCYVNNINLSNDNTISSECIINTTLSTKKDPIINNTSREENNGNDDDKSNNIWIIIGIVIIIIIFGIGSSIIASIVVNRYRKKRKL